MLHEVLPPRKRIHCLLRMSQFRRSMRQIRKLEKVLLKQRRGHQRGFESLQNWRGRGMVERTGQKMALHVLPRTHILGRREMPPLRPHLEQQLTMNQIHFHMSWQKPHGKRTRSMLITAHMLRSYRPKPVCSLTGVKK
jgi:hypothetical protein